MRCFIWDLHLWRFVQVYTVGIFWHPGRDEAAPVYMHEMKYISPAAEQMWNTIQEEVSTPRRNGSKSVVE